MRIIICCWDDPGGVAGPGAWERRLALHCAENNDKVRVLSFVDSANSGDGDNFRFFKGTEVEVSGIARTSMRQQVEWILRHVREHKARVLLASNVVAAHYASHCCSRLGCSVISVIHSDESFYNKIIRNFFPSGNYHQVHGAIVVSQLLKKRVESYRLGELKLEQVPYGSPIPDAVAKPPVKKLRLIYVGRLSQRQKRVLDVARALCLACDQVHDTEALIVGHGAEEAAVIKLLKSTPGGQNVTLVGRLPLEDVQELMAQCHIYVLLSDYEGNPIALMEAMAAGLVPVVSNIESGVPELVENGVTGFYAPERADDFVRVIRRLRDDVGLWSAVSRSSRSLIKSGFAASDCMDRTRKFLLSFGLRKDIEKADRIAPESIEFRGVCLTESWADPSMFSFPKSVLSWIVVLGWSLWGRMPWAIRCFLKKIASRGW